MTRFIALLAVLLAVASARSAWAHVAPHSTVLLDFHATDVAAELRLPVPELEAALGRTLDHEAAGIEREAPAFRALVERDLHARSPDGAAWTVRTGAVRYAVDDQVPIVVVNAVLAPPSGHSARVFTLVNDVIGKQVMNHAAWVDARTDFAQGLVSGAPSLLGVTRYLHHQLLVDRREGGALRGFLAVFQLGMRHIADGSDHLLFLLALLLPAPLVLVSTPKPRWGTAASMRESVGKILRVVSAFTLGHSLTLAVGVLGWLQLPSAAVETLIAVSILCSAAHAFRPLFPGRETWIAAGFGLIHGLAFASALGALALDPAHLALCLLGFNLGIEAMQLAVIALTFPWLLLLARTPFYAAFRGAGALFAGSAALAWIAQRGLHVALPVDVLVHTLTARPELLLALLAAATISARCANAFTPNRDRFARAR